MDITLNAAGQPVIAYHIVLAGPTNSMRYARWDGSAWNYVEIVQIANWTAGYVGGMCLDHEAPNQVYLDKTVGSHREIWRYVTTDGGLTFVGEAITTGSSFDNWYPVDVRNHAPDLKAMWLAGTYVTYTNFSFGTSGTDR